MTQENNHRKSDGNPAGDAEQIINNQPAAEKTAAAVPAPQLSFTMAANQNPKNTYSFTPQPPPPPAMQQRPPIPPEIGPDPRNAQANLNLDGEPTLEAGNGVRFDFNFGFRIKMPADNRVYSLLVYDADTQTMIANMTVPGGEMAVGDRKYFLRYYFRVLDQATGQLVAEHYYNCENMPVMIIIPDGGLGDNMAWVPYAEEFRRKHHARVTCVCGEWLIRIVRDLYPELDFAPVANIPNSRYYYASYFCAIFPPERKLWRPSDHQNFGMQGTIAKVLGVDPVPRKMRFPHYPERPVKEPYVCISVLATNPAKYWNFPDGWNILCRYLKQLGYRVFVIDRDHDLIFNQTVYSVPAEAEDCTGMKPITERMAMLQHAEFFVGLPSGLSWLAWNCNTPVVLISGFTMDGSEFPTPYRVFNQNFCHGCWNDSNCFFDAHAPVWCPRHLGTEREIECTRAITPKMVIDAVNRIPAVCKQIRPAVTFALPAHDPEETLFPQVLQSVIERAREYGNAEILIRDDASVSPATKIRIEEFRRKNPDLIFAEYAEKSEGAPAAMRNLLDRAKGKYFIALEQNSLLLPFDLLRTIQKLEANPEILANYGKNWFFNEKGPEKCREGIPFSQFQSLYSQMQVQDGAIFRTDALKKCNAPATGDTPLFHALALAGTCEYDPEVRLLKFRRSVSTPGNAANNLSQLIEPYREIVSQLEAGICPEEKAGVPLAAIAGAFFRLQQKNTALIAKLLPQFRQRFPMDPGVRMVYLQYLATQKDNTLFKAEWDSAIRDFTEPETLYSVLNAAALLVLKQGLFSIQQRNFLEKLRDRWQKIPGAVIDAWNNLPGPKK